MVDAMAKVAATLKVGSPDEKGVMLGPTQNQMQVSFQNAKNSVDSL